MGKIILCLDDQPVKYREFRKIASQHNIIVVTTCRFWDFEEYALGPDEILAICVDYEMPFGTGVYFLRLIKEYNIETQIILSDQDNYGLKKLKETCEELNLKYQVIGWESLAELAINHLLSGP